jgi:outer membrane protein assembly factor BamB
LEAYKQKALAERDQIKFESGFPPLHFADGVVFTENLANNLPNRTVYSKLKDEVVAFDAATGKLLWTTPGNAPGVWTHEGVARVLVARGGAAGGSVACVDLKTGKELWTAPVEGGGAFRGNPAVESSFQLRLLGSCLVTIYVGKTDASYLVGYKVEPTGLKKLWKQTYEKGHLHSNNVMTMHKGLLYTKLISANGMTLVAMEAETGKIVAQADLGAAGSARNGVLIVNDGLAILQKDGSHPGGGAATYVHRLPDLQLLGQFQETHNMTSGYDTPMAFQYVDGRLIIRGCNRIICYDLRAK